MVLCPLSNECFCRESKLGQADADPRGRSCSAARRYERCSRQELRDGRAAPARNCSGHAGRLCSPFVHTCRARSRARCLSFAEPRAFRGCSRICAHAKSLGRRRAKPDHRHIRLARTPQGKRKFGGDVAETIELAACCSLGGTGSAFGTHFVDLEHRRIAGGTADGLNDRRDRIRR